MARPKRKAPKSKPVSQHQLFPAVVALWFGALFGLGSLAVRPSLLEELVIKSRIDLLIPAAAPPLGMTARMVVALVLAALGAMIGTKIARHLARPRQEARERKRTNLSTRDEGASSSWTNAYTDASTGNPDLSGGDAAAAAAPGVLANRRRSLAIEQDEGYFVPHDNAPLPGGSPMIFDIAASGLNDAPPPPAAIELGSYAEPVPVAAPITTALDWANAAPVQPPVTPLASPQVPAAMAPVQTAFAPESEAPPLATAADDQRQVFGAVPPITPPVDQPRQIFGMPVTDDHVPKEFVEAQGFQSSVFQAPEPNPLFPVRAEAEAEAERAAPASASPQPQAAVPEAFASPPESAEPVEVTLRVAPVLAVETALEPVLPDPASLGIEDLSSRLAETMRRRRTARAGGAGVAAIEPAPPLPAPPEASPTAALFTLSQAAEPAVPAAVTEIEAVPAYTVPSFTVPPFTVPAAADVPASQPPIPAAMRPLDLTGFEEDDDDAHVNLLPPRRIAQPVSVEATPAAVAPPISAPVASEPEIVDDDPEAEENYASLLGVTPTPASLRNPFVRVEESELESGSTEVEPVVIFPGQAMQTANPFNASAGNAVDEASAFRRFDAPASAEHGQPSIASDAATAVPREEAELALRSALANLQRMSGAA